MPLFDDSLFDGSESPAAYIPPPSGSLGRFQLGDKVPLLVNTVDGTGLPVTPDAAPLATITSASGAVVATVKLAMNGSLTSFALGFLLGYQFSLGTYSVTYSYSFSGNAGTATNTFDVVGGGDPGGSVISMTSYAQPGASYIVAQLSSGNLVQGRNPRL